MITNSDAGNVVLIDVRAKPEYDAGHIPQSHSFPWEEITLHACALPGRDAAIQVLVGEEVDLESVRAYFHRLHFEACTVSRYRDISVAEHLTVEPPSAPCWKPNSFLSDVIERVERQCGGCGVALDVGCGTGRDMSYLAMRGWTTLGIDNRANLLKNGQRLSRRHNVAGYTQFIRHTLRGALLPARRGVFDLVVACRFLHRDGLEELFTLPKLDGGYLLYSHFLDGCQHTPVGHPATSSEFVFRGELKNLAEQQGYIVEHYSETVLSDGRPFAHLLARRGAKQDK